MRQFKDIFLSLALVSIGCAGCPGCAGGDIGGTSTTVNTGGAVATNNQPVITGETDCELHCSPVVIDGLGGFNVDKICSGVETASAFASVAPPDCNFTFTEVPEETVS